MATTLRYTLADRETYQELATFAVTLTSEVTLYPQMLSIVVCDEDKDIVADYLNDHDIIPAEEIELSTDYQNVDELFSETMCGESILRYVAETYKGDKEAAEKRIEHLKTDRDLYRQFYNEVKEKSNRVEEQVKALAVLINNIYPQK